jgi:hypothetical protein
MVLTSRYQVCISILVKRFAQLKHLVAMIPHLAELVVTKDNSYQRSQQFKPDWQRNSSWVFENFSGTSVPLYGTKVVFH